MDIEEAIGRVEVSLGSNSIIDVNGKIREVNDTDYIYQGEQLCSDDIDSLLQVKYVNISEATTYIGIFNVLVDDSVMLGLNGHENLLSASHTLDLSNVSNLDSSEVLELTKTENIIETIEVFEFMRAEDDIQIVYEGDFSDIGYISSSLDKVNTADVGYDVHINTKSTILVDIPILIDDTLIDS